MKNFCLFLRLTPFAKDLRTPCHPKFGGGGETVMLARCPVHTWAQQETSALKGRRIFSRCIMAGWLHGCFRVSRAGINRDLTQEFIVANSAYEPGCETGQRLPSLVRHRRLSRQVRLVSYGHRQRGRTLIAGPQFRWPQLEKARRLTGDLKVE